MNIKASTPAAAPSSYSNPPLLAGKFKRTHQQLRLQAAEALCASSSKSVNPQPRIGETMVLPLNEVSKLVGRDELNELVHSFKGTGDGNNVVVRLKDTSALTVDRFLETFGLRPAADGTEPETGDEDPQQI